MDKNIKQRKVLLLKIFTVIVVWMLPVTCQMQTIITGKVVKVSDGDTFTLVDANNQQVKIRLYGIDCPEKEQDFGEQARLKTASLIAGKTVDVITHGIDRYGRSLGIVTLDKTTLNEELLIAGLAWNYHQYNKFYPNYDKLEKEARALKKGLWIIPNPQAPWDYRNGKRNNSEMHTGNIPVTENKVIVCNSRSSVSYHSHECHALSKCRAGTSIIDVSEAKSKNYKPCKICY